MTSANLLIRIENGKTKRRRDTFSAWRRPILSQSIPARQDGCPLQTFPWLSRKRPSPPFPGGHAGHRIFAYFCGMDAMAEFIARHADDDVARLLLSRDRWPGIDVGLAADTILSRRKLRGKVPEWLDFPGLILPSPLSAEQCSSSETATYKASLAEGICVRTGCARRLADLTGGLGVDCAAFARVMDEVLYNDADATLAEAARHNLKVMGIGNVSVNSSLITASTLSAAIGDFGPGIVFLDPARRDAAGRKVFMLSDCSPDVTELLPELLRLCRHILLKVSPMADIDLLMGQLPHVREAHVVASGGECKELLLWVDRDWDGTPEMVIRESGRCLRTDFGARDSGGMAFLRDEAELREATVLFEPGKALSKAGLFAYPCTAWGMAKAGRHTHLYFTDPQKATAWIAGTQAAEATPWDFGKFFIIKEIVSLSRQGAKLIARKWPVCELTARNLPLTTDALSRKIGLRQGGDTHIFACRIDFSSAIGGNWMIVTEKFCKSV